MQTINAKEFFNMNIIDINRTITQINDDTLKYLVQDTGSLLQSSDEIFRIFYTRVNSQIKSLIISNDLLLNKVLNIKKNSLGKDLFIISDINIKIEILKKIKTKGDHKKYLSLIKSIPQNEFEEVTSKIDMNSLLLNDEMLKDFILENINIVNNEFLKSVIIKLKQKPNLICFLLKTTNILQLFILIKFEILVNLEIYNNFAVFKDGSTLLIDTIYEINSKHISILCNDLKKSEGINENYKILINAIKLYKLFGFDGAKKIINGTFTNMTDKALNRIAETVANEQKNNCRTNNEREFFSNQLVKKVHSAVDNKNLEYIKNLFLITEKRAYEFINNFNKTNEKDELIRTYINMRENEILIYNIDKFKKEKSNIKNVPLTNDRIYKLFYNVNTTNLPLDEKGMPIIDEDFIKFMLGDLRKDNDCLLRLIINNLAYGLENSIDIVINKFKLIKDIINNSDNKISFFNIVDILDISKVFIYDAKPDERDIPYTNLVNLVNDTNFIKETKDEVFRKTLLLHKQKKFKTFASIPTVCGEINGIEYKVMDFDDPNLITIGVNNGSCFRVGAIGENFLRYALLNPSSVIIELKDEKGNKYTCPVVRNGNGIYANGIDPKIPNELTRIKLMKALEECGKQIIFETQNNDKVDFFSISNLNQLLELHNDGYIELDMEKYESIDDIFHSDYQMSKNEKNKQDRRRVFIIAHNGNIKPKYYISNDKYFQKRIPSIKYDSENKQNYREIQLLINSIKYSNIDYQEISAEEKHNTKRNFDELNPDDFRFIWANKDWFIAMDFENNIIKELLPYDQRARSEFATALVIFATMLGKEK